MGTKHTYTSGINSSFLRHVVVPIAHDIFYILYEEPEDKSLSAQNTPNIKKMNKR
jgi:hypothetical protein